MKGFLIFIILAAETLLAAPDFYESEVGGYVGFLSAGVGYQPWEGVYSSVIYGYVPKELGGTELHQVTWKNTACLLSSYTTAGNQITPLYAGLSGIYGFDKDLFTILPSHYPERYYAPTSLHAIATVGSSVKVANWEYYGELATLDYDLIAYLENLDSVNFQDVSVFGFGVKWYLSDH